MNKYILYISILMLLIALAWNWALFLPDSIYSKEIFDIKIPKTALNIKIHKIGIYTPRIEFNLKKTEFEQFKINSIKNGYFPWTVTKYDSIHDPSSLLQKITLGTSLGNTGTMYECNRVKGKASFVIAYDENTETLIAIKNY